jgi:Ca2+-binding EF-hand superfamily protein
MELRKHMEIENVFNKFDEDGSGRIELKPSREFGCYGSA